MPRSGVVASVHPSIPCQVFTPPAFATGYTNANGEKIAMLPGKDAVVHTNGPASGNWALLRWNLPTPQNTGGDAYTVKAGDQLCSRQYANNAYGGPIVWFSNGMSTTWSWNASEGQWLNHMASPQNQWVSRCMDLSGGGQTTDSTITLSVLRDSPTPAGPWDIYYADMSITSADGTVTQIAGSNPTIDPTPYFNIGDKTFEAEQKKDQANGMNYCHGSITDSDGAKQGTYSHDPDIAGDPSANIAAMGNIGNRGMSAIKYFVAGRWPVRVRPAQQVSLNLQRTR